MLRVGSADQFHSSHMTQDVQQSSYKGREEADCRHVNMDVNNAGFTYILYYVLEKKSVLLMFYEEGNAFSTFVRAQRYM